VRRDTVRVPVLKEAVIHTASKRGSLDDLQDWKEIVQDIRSEVALQQLWTNYIQDNQFASGLTFSEVVDTVETIGNLLEIGASE
jgi:hypothetical protein